MPARAPSRGQRPRHIRREQVLRGALLPSFWAVPAPR